MSTNLSIAVLGAGPAGILTALELAQRGHQVVIIDRQRAPGWKIGETLPPEARSGLQRLGLWTLVERQSHRPCYGIVSTWGSERPVEKNFLFHPQGHGFQLDRRRFEEGLANEAVRVGCQLRYGAHIRQLCPTSEGWTVELESSTHRADWIVDCTGRQSVLPPRFRGAYLRLDNLVSVFSIGNSIDGSDTDSRTYVESSPSGWYYSALMPSGHRIVAFQTDGELLPDVEVRHDWVLQQLAPHSKIAALLETDQLNFPNPPRVVAAHSGRFERVCGHRWLAVGDAAMTFDPLSGQGLAKALESARWAVRAIADDDSYQLAADRLWDDFLIARTMCYQAEARWAHLPFWAQRH